MSRRGSRAQEKLEAERISRGKQGAQRRAAPALEVADRRVAHADGPRKPRLTDALANSRVAKLGTDGRETHAGDCASSAQVLSSPDVPHAQHASNTVPPMQWPITQRWLELVRAAMEREGYSQSDIARRVGCKPSTINRIVNGIAPSSRHVEAISRALSVPLPGAIAEELADKEAWLLAWDGMYQRLSARQRLLLLDLARELLG